jgi:hypothetical protein
VKARAVRLNSHGVQASLESHVFIAGDGVDGLDVAVDLIFSHFYSWCILLWRGARAAGHSFLSCRPVDAFVLPAGLDNCFESSDAVNSLGSLLLGLLGFAGNGFELFVAQA